MTAVNPASSAAGSSSSAAGRSGVFPYTHRPPVSTGSAAGKYCRRTAEFTPSAPTSTSASASRPSAKWTRTPFSPPSYRVTSLPNTILPSSPAASTSRSVSRLTDVMEAALRWLAEATAGKTPYLIRKKILVV